MVIREGYIQKLRPFYESDLIKVICGIRRSGKSVLLKQICDEISQNTDNIIFLEFENSRVRNVVSSAQDIIDYVDKNRKAGKCYIFLDEIQLIDNWQDACQTLRMEDNSVFITGSNSKLLSKEFLNVLSGRYVSVRVRPFVYKEILEYYDEFNKSVSVTDYLTWGGFPMSLQFDGDAKLSYFDDLNETIIYRDIISRYKIRKEEVFRAVANFIFLSNARIVSSNSIYKAIKQKIQCSENTVSKYINYIEEAYAIERIKQYSTKTKGELSFFYKIYNEDVSLNSIRCTNGRFDIDHNLENIVYNELIYMGYDLLVYNSNKAEIDFIATKNNKKFYIQVAYSVVDEKAYEREMSAFESVKDALSAKVLITNDEVDYSTSIVKHIKLKDFLRLDSLDNI